MLLARCQQLAAIARRAGASDFVCTGSIVLRHETTQTERGRQGLSSQHELLTLALTTGVAPLVLTLSAHEVDHCDAKVQAAVRFWRAADTLRRASTPPRSFTVWDPGRSVASAATEARPLPRAVADVDSMDAVVGALARWDRIDRFRLDAVQTARSDVWLAEDGRTATHHQAAQSLGLQVLTAGPQGLLSRRRDWHFDDAHTWDAPPSAQQLVDEAERVANDLYDALLSAPPAVEAPMVVLTAQAAAPFLAAPGVGPGPDAVAQREDAPALATLVGAPPWLVDGTAAVQPAASPDDPGRLRCVRVAAQDHTARNLLGRVSRGYLVDGAAAWEWLADGRIAVGFDAAWYVEAGEILHAVRDASLVMTAAAFWSAIRAVGDADTTARVVLRPASPGAIVVDAPALLVDPAMLQNHWVQTPSVGPR